MGSVLSNAILAFLESDRGGTLADLRRFLIEPAFRDKFLATVRDPDIVYYWQKGFPQLSGNKSIGPVLTRLETILSRKPIRYMVSQRENKLDFANILDTGKIFLAKLPLGQMGKENAFLLGSLLIAKFQQLAMSRQAQRAESRRPFWLYVDEFQNFITPSMAEILSGARKYRLGLILAHQELRQLQRDAEVASAVLSNPYTRVVFRVGDADAKALESGFANFEARDLQNLGTGEAICRLERSDGDFNLRVPFPEESNTDAAEQTRQNVITASREKYATPRADIEAALWAKFDAGETEPGPVKAKPTSPSLPKIAETKATEVRKATGSEKESVPIVVSDPTPAVPVETVEAHSTTASEEEESLHTRIKNRIRTQAESLDFTVRDEEFVADGMKRADLGLTRGNRRIACEISVTNTAYYETEINISKCLKAGYQHVAMICASRRKLENIQKRFLESSPTQGERVGFYLPDEFISKLADWAVDDPEGGAIEQGKPRKRSIRLGAAALTEADRRQQENEWLKEMERRMKGGEGAK